jgi:hypothetical protein
MAAALPVNVHCATSYESGLKPSARYAERWCSCAKPDEAARSQRCAVETEA